MKHFNWIISIIEQLISAKYTGKLEINFFKGGIANATKVESLKPPQPEQGGQHG